MNKTGSALRDPIPLALALVLAAATAGVLIAGPAETVPAMWKAVAASGDVESLPGQDLTTDWRRVSRGDRLEPESLVRTGRRGRATLALGKSVILVDPGSQLRLPEHPAQDGPARVVQRSGSAVYDIDGSKHGPVEVVTPYLVAGVKGTVFGVSVGDGYALVSVEEGHVEVRSTASGETRDLHAGEAVMIEASASARLEMLERREGSRRDDPRRSAHDALKRVSDVADRKTRGEDDDRDSRDGRKDRGRQRDHGDDGDLDDVLGGVDSDEPADEKLNRELDDAEEKQEALEEELRELGDGRDEPGLEDPVDPGDIVDPEEPLDPAWEDGDGKLPDPREHGGDGGGQ